MPLQVLKCHTLTGTGASWLRTGPVDVAKHLILLGQGARGHERRDGLQDLSQRLGNIYTAGPQFAVTRAAGHHNPPPMLSMLPPPTPWP